MKGSEFAASLPEGKTAAQIADRERSIVQAVDSGHYIHDFNTFEVTGGGHRAIITVSRDTLQIGERDDSFRVSLSASAQLHVAGLLGCRLLTPKLADIIYERAEVKLIPLTQAWWQDGSMAHTRRMLEQSRAIDARLATAGADRDALVANAGKDWVMLRSLPRGRAANYGWIGSGKDKSVTGLPIVQSVGTAHDDRHVDYSQLPRFVLRYVQLDGVDIDIDDVLADPSACKLIAHDGPFNPSEAPDTDPAPPPKVTPPPTRVVTVGDEPGVSFVQAKNYTVAGRSSVDLLVMHTAELALTGLSAENLQSWCAGPNAPKASWHYAVDSNSITQSVRERDVAWHAKQANRVGIGIELCARAAWTAARWIEPDALDMLQRAAELAARICKRWNIPLVRLTPDQVKAGARGICGHHDVTRAYATPGGHTDPGAAFPWDWLLSRMRELG